MEIYEGIIVIVALVLFIVLCVILFPIVYREQEEEDHTYEK